MPARTPAKGSPRVGRHPGRRLERRPRVREAPAGWARASVSVRTRARRPPAC